MKQHRLLLPLLILLLMFVACRKEWLPTEEDMADYGWTLYQAQRFKESNHWFSKAVKEDENYKDGYNGMGWSEIKMSLLAYLNLVTRFCGASNILQLFRLAHLDQQYLF